MASLRLVSSRRKRPSPLNRHRSKHQVGKTILLTDLLNISFLNVHLTTFLTYIFTAGTGYIFASKYRILFAIGITAIATFCFEGIYLGFDVLLAGGKGFSWVDIAQWTGTVYFCLVTASWIVKPKIDKYLFLLIVCDVIAWGAWLPSFHLTFASRIYADPIKTLLTLTVLLPFRGDRILMLEAVVARTLGIHAQKSVSASTPQNSK